MKVRFLCAASLLCVVSFTQSAVAQDIFSNDETLSLIESLVTEGVSDEIGISATTDDIKKKCDSAAKAACHIYCKFLQEEYSYGTCMRGKLWYDGCTQKIRKKCIKHRKKKQASSETAPLN